MTTGAWVLIAAVAVAVAFGLYRAQVDGRFRGTHAVRGAQPTPVDLPLAGRVASGADGSAGRVASEASGPAGRVASEASVSRPWAALGIELGERATFVQFSSAFCAPCRATRRILGDVAGAVPGVVHHEIDAEHHLDVVRQLGILRTPTTLVLDARGVEVARAAGAPSKEQALAQVGALT